MNLQYTFSYIEKALYICFALYIFPERLVLTSVPSLFWKETLADFITLT